MGSGFLGVGWGPAGLDIVIEIVEKGLNCAVGGSSPSFLQSAASSCSQEERPLRRGLL